jgi:hypothetical protein
MKIGVNRPGGHIRKLTDRDLLQQAYNLASGDAKAKALKALKVYDAKNK